MAVLEAAATSRLLRPAMFALSASILSFTSKLSAPQSSRTRRAYSCERRMSLRPPASRRNVGMSSPEIRMEIGIPTPPPASSSRTSMVAPATRLLSSFCRGPISDAVRMLAFGPQPCRLERADEHLSSED